MEYIINDLGQEQTSFATVTLKDPISDEQISDYTMANYGMGKLEPKGVRRGENGFVFYKGLRNEILNQVIENLQK